MRDVIIFLALFVLAWNYAGESILRPIATIIGLALAYFGVAMFFPLRRWLYQHAKRSALRVDFLSILVSLMLALVSLTVWNHMFTFEKGIIVDDQPGLAALIAKGLQWLGSGYNKLPDNLLIGLWFMLTWLFGYLFFVSRKVFSLASDERTLSAEARVFADAKLPQAGATQHLTSDSGHREIDRPASLGDRDG